MKKVEVFHELNISVDEFARGYCDADDSTKEFAQQCESIENLREIARDCVNSLFPHCGDIAVTYSQKGVKIAFLRMRKKGMEILNEFTMPYDKIISSGTGKVVEIGGLPLIIEAFPV